MENTYKLYYFNGNGRAVNIRAILHYVNASWEDVRYTFEDWGKEKTSGKFEYGQMPGLEVNGKMMTQTIAIELYLARKFGLMGSNDEEDYQILNVVCTRDDYTKPLYGLLMPTEEQKLKRDEIIKNLNDNVFPTILATIEKKYIQNGKGKYFLGDKFSFADIFLATGFTQLFEAAPFKDLFGQIPSKHSPNVLELVNRIKANDLKSYFEKIHLHDSMF